MKYLFILFLFSSCSNTIYVVRHAEKVLIPASASNPQLTQAGLQRANALKNYFGFNKPDSIFISGFLRTQQTAAPTATSALVTPIIINQADTNAINDFITRLYKMQRKKVLIVGHSNTVPRIVKELTGQTISAIAETDYDNMYIIKIRKNHKWFVQTTYGAVSP